MVCCGQLSVDIELAFGVARRFHRCENFSILIVGLQPPRKHTGPLITAYCLLPTVFKYQLRHAAESFGSRSPVISPRAWKAQP
jgi:hypothetical protein